MLVTSPLTAATLTRDFGVPEGRITVALPGVDPAPLAKGDGDLFRILCVGTLIPRKGHRVLLEALARVLDITWELDCIGSCNRDPQTSADIQVAAEALGLANRVRLMGEVEEEVLAHAYNRADLLVSASFYEGYGIGAAEAGGGHLPREDFGCSADSTDDSAPHKSAAFQLVPRHT